MKDISASPSADEISGISLLTDIVKPSVDNEMKSGTYTLKGDSFVKQHRIICLIPVHCSMMPEIVSARFE
jgi:hypothetical protein